MRALFAGIVLAAAGCGKEPEPPPPPGPPPPAARPPRSGAEAGAKPPEEAIAFVRRGALWVIAPDGTRARAVAAIEAPADPAWSPDRQWIAFSAAADGPFNLYARNVFVVRADGTELRQVTPLPRAGLFFEDAPKGIVRGRAVQALAGGARKAVPGLRVTAYGTRRTEETGPDGVFQIYAPAGGGWVRLSGEADGRRVSVWRATLAEPGKPQDLKDVVVGPGGDDAAAAPSWTADGKRLAYQHRRSLVDRADVAGPVSLRIIERDGAKDVTLLVGPKAAIVAGPIVRGGSAWFKSLDGRLSRVDLDTRKVAESIDVGIAVPDALALSPDGAAFATLRMDESGGTALVLVRRNPQEAAAVEPLASFRKGDAHPRALDFSPDGKRMALDLRTEGGASDLWVLDLATRRMDRITQDGASSDPVWNGR
jgi:dipeptidyl aminopeptidase/acylaminoacyl peptidase